MIDKIEQILINADIMRLIAIGAPSDEYHHESIALAERLKEYNSSWTAEQVANVVYGVFKDQFCSWERYRFFGTDKQIFLGITKAETQEEVEKEIGKIGKYIPVANDIKTLLDT